MFSSRLNYLPGRDERLQSGRIREAQRVPPRVSPPATATLEAHGHNSGGPDDRWTAIIKSPLMTAERALNENV